MIDHLLNIFEIPSINIDVPFLIIYPPKFPVSNDDGR